MSKDLFFDIREADLLSSVDSADYAAVFPAKQGVGSGYYRVKGLRHSTEHVSIQPDYVVSVHISTNTVSGKEYIRIERQEPDLYCISKEKNLVEISPAEFTSVLHKALKSAII